MPDPDDAADRSNFPDPSDWTIDPQAPENDGRVVWLIREIGGPRALAHRCEDIRRHRWGRATTGVGRPMVQPSEFADIETGPDEGGLGQADAVNIWRGVLITAERTFRPDDDVCKLLRCWPKSLGCSKDHKAHAGLWEDLSRFSTRSFLRRHGLTIGSRTQKSVC